MRALTVRQPWAWAIVHGGKDVENRTRNVAGGYRGPVAIHAGLTPDTAAQGSWPLGDLVPMEAWRLPRARAERLEDLHHPDVVRRQAAEAAWLAEHRAHGAGATDA